MYPSSKHLLLFGDLLEEVSTKEKTPKMVVEIELNDSQQVILNVVPDIAAGISMCCSIYLIYQDTYNDIHYSIKNEQLRHIVILQFHHIIQSF